MKKKFICVLTCLFLVAAFFSGTASADMGPKPSVVIDFQGLGDELCYGTLLSSTSSTGPSSVWDGRKETAQYRENKGYEWAELNYDAWKAFSGYEDEDGYYFLQEGWRIDETKKLAWTYYPPESFKILLYFPEKEAFAVSGVCERYAFDSYFTVDMEGFALGKVSVADGKGEKPEEAGPRLPAVEKSYDYAGELGALAARIVMTVLLEAAVALLFGYRTRKQLLLITGVNAATQSALNILLNVVDYQSGYMAFVFFYGIFEIAVFAVEAALFSRLLSGPGEKPRGRQRVVAYAFAANLLSFGAGFALAKALPGILF